MTSKDMITSLASMTSTASLASKNKKLNALYILSEFPGIRNLSSLNDRNSLLTGIYIYSMFIPLHISAVQVKLICPFIF